MLNTALVIAVAGGGVMGQVYPDELDILRGADTTPQIEAVLDTSGSMGPMDGTQATSCNYFYQQYRAANDATYGLTRAAGDQAYPLMKFEMLQASLTGCQSATDGVLDQWASRVLFAVREFGGNLVGGVWQPRVNLRANFDPTLSNLPALEAAVLALQPSGYTPMAFAYAQAGLHMAGYFNNTNSAKCRQSYIVLMTDGQGNGPPTPSLTFAAGNAPLIFNDASWGTPHSDRGAQYFARTDADYFTFVDALPGVTGVQPIRTYSIAFQAPAAPAALLLQVANAGDGAYYDATSYQQLNNAFTQIILSVVARSNVSFNPGTVQNDGIFAGNYIYTAAFRPYQAGNWFGTTKKYCVIPSAPADTTCIFMDDGSGNLVTNTQPVDVWTGSANTSATTGGTGQKIWQSLFGNATSPASPVPANPLNRRRIYTWEPGTSGYVAINGSNTWQQSDSWAATNCDHHALMNKLHGYTAQVQDCAGGNYAPVALEQWPLGDTVHGGTVVIKYTKNCEAGTDQCYVATVANDGMVHFFNAITGVETSAIVPGHLWSPNQVATHQLKDLMDQPNLNEMRRYYFDGGVKLFHDDTNSNGYIDGTETARLVAGLGRGGKSYIMWDMASFNGIPSNGNNPPLELMVDESSSFRNLRETWAAPWMGRYRHADGNLYNVGVFPSGHDREFDRPTTPMGNLINGLPIPSGDTKTTPNSRGCSAFGLPAALCNPPFPNTTCIPCNDPLGPLGSCAPPIATVYCYDWPGYIGNPLVPVPFNGSGGPGVGHDILLGPYSFSDTNHIGVAFEIVFAHFDLQPNDYVAVLDSNQNEVGRLTGSYGGSQSLPWVHDTSFYLRFVSDGFDTAPTTGFRVQRVNMIRATHTSVTPTSTWRPTMYVVDINRWNSAVNAAAGKFPSRPAAGDTRQQAGVLARITSDCEGLQTAGEVCVDANGTGGQAPQPDLQYMVCPISAEPSVLTEGGVFQGVYWGDECGQIFRARRDTTGAWQAKRLLRLNNAGVGGFTVAGNASKDYRKIFTQLELVISTCNGSRAVGAYFGTGNLQRPALFDNMTTPAVTTFPGMLATIGEPNVIGVVWDYPSLPNNLGIDGLANVTTQIQVADPRSGNAQNGWFIELGYEEKMLRDPLVFDGVAYFKMYGASTPATECISADGAERTFAMDNCTARPIADGNMSGTVADSVGDRQVASSDDDIGGDLALFTPKGQPAFVGDPTSRAVVAAKLAARPNSRTTKFHMWRLNVDPLF